MAKGKKAKRSRGTKPPQGKPPLDLHQVFREHKEAILVALAVLHVLLFLVFFLNMAAAISPQGADTFGDKAPDAPTAIATGPTPHAKPVAVSYGLFSIVLWIAVAELWRRGARRRRERRFTMMMLTPGTVMCLFLLWRAFASAA